MTTSLYPHTKSVFVQSVDLVVRNLEMVSRYYQDVIGLNLIEGGSKRHILGSDIPLLTLHGNNSASPSPRHAAGLFHTAFLLPTRKDLAHQLKHVVENRIPLLGVADHLVSEAIYFTDPEGNGVEVYADRPHQDWQFDKEGVVMDTLNLDTQNLLSVSPNEPWRKLPNGTAIGHIHLQVGNIHETENFYRDVMGLKVMHRTIGAAFFSSGDYHHHIAANTWMSHGTTPRQDGMTDLSGYTLLFNNESDLLRTIKKFENINTAAVNTPVAKFVKDPWVLD